MKRLSYPRFLARAAMTLLAVFCFIGARAQTTVEIGDGGTAKNTYLPGYNLYYYSLTQQIYTADEIGMAGTINSIAFKNTGAEKTRTYNVYMLLTDKETFTGGTDWVAMSDGDLVFAGELTFSVGEWTTITLDNPFSYDGVSNLLVGVADNTGSESFSPHMACLVFDATSQAIRAYRDAGAYDIAAPGSGTVMDVKNQIQLEITPAGGQICEKPEALTANGEPTDTEFSFTIEGGSGLYNIELKAGSGDWTNWEYEWEETEVNLTGLTGNTTYQVRVQSVCDDMNDPETGDAATSGWKTLSFKTKNPCAAPTNLQITDVTTESATLTWTPGYQETTWTVKYKKSSEAWDDAIVETVNGTPSLTLSGLSSLTTYNVQVYNCDNYVSANFTTAAGIPLTEAFATSSAPTGWTRYSGLLSDVMGGTALTSITSGWSFGTGNNVFDSHAKVNIYGTNCKYWLVTPALLMEDNVQLTFDMALTVWSSSSSNSPTPGNQADDKFIVLITTDGGTTWEILREWNNTDSEYVYDEITNSAVGQAVAIDLSSYAGQNIAIAFYGESTNPSGMENTGGDNNLHIDNVSIDYIPACAKPTGLAASDLTAHEATITWTSDAAAWQVQLDDEAPVDVTEATYTFTGLTPATTYTAQVRSNCNGTPSEWTNPISFTTTIACPAPTNLAVSPDALSATFTWESFAGAWEVAYATDATADPAENIVATVNEATYTVNDLEVGDYYFWVRGNCGDVDGNSQWAGPVKVHIGYCVPNPTSHDGSGITGVSFGMGDYVVENGGEGVSIPATSPYYGDYSDMIGAVQAGVESTISITTATGSYPYTFVIWVDFDNSLSFEDSEIVYIGKASSGNGTHEAKITVPADQAVGEYRMRIYGADSYFNSFYNNGETNWEADHNPCVSGSYRHANDYTLRVLEAPSCLTPTDLAIDYTGGSEATVSWTSGAEAWNLSVNDVVIENVTNPYTLTSLELATTYSVKVQAVCGEDGTSEWSNPVSFSTDICMPEDQCTISYSFTDQYDDSWNNAYINIVDAQTGIVLHELTMPNVAGPFEGSFNVCDGRDIQFVWVSGNYPRECGYTFTDINGEIILEKEAGTAAPAAGVVLTYLVNCGVDPCMTPQKLAAAEITASSAKLSWKGNNETYNLRYSHPVDADPTATTATIILEAHDVWGDYDDSGYQMLLDADATAYGNEIPETGGTYTATDYSAFEYLIPENAECSGTTENIVWDGSVTIQIPAGTYDWCIINPTDGTMWIAANSGNIAGRYDDFKFEAGLTYHFTMQQIGTGDGAMLEITPMSDWIVVENVTSPYDITGLTPDTYYEWQVQGICSECEGGATDWSASSRFFTEPIVEIELANDATDISTIIAANAGKYANVTLTDRTLFKDGNWNTLCLPFDVTLDGSQLEGAEAKTLTVAEVNGEHVSLTFGEAVTKLTAGTPYIIRWKGMTKGTGDIEDPVFENVKMVNSTPTAIPFAEDNVKFIGYYNAMPITAADKNIYYMTADNTLKHTGIDRTLKSLRAYFWFSDDLVDSGSTSRFTLNFGDGESTGIISIDSEQLESNWYTIDGKMLDKQPTRKGVYIKDGVKVVIK